MEEAPPVLAPLACAARYESREPEDTVLHQVVRENLETFLARCRDPESHHRWPVYVQREFHRFLDCGVLAAGFVRVWCPACRTELLVGMSCKGRGFCSSCITRRASNTAANLVDRIVPEVPVRQWVLSLPMSIRFRVATHPEVISEILGSFLRTVFDWIKEKIGAQEDESAQCGAVSFIQWFGGSANQNTHLHVAVLDGAFRQAKGDVGPRFHSMNEPPCPEEIESLTARVASKLVRLLKRRGIVREEEYEELDVDPPENPTMARCVGASIIGRIAFGPRSGQRVERIGCELDPLRGEGSDGLLQGRGDVLDLHVGAVIEAHDRHRLEHLFRYAARPPIASERLSLTPEGDVLYQLKKPWSDGTTHLKFTPLEFMEKLAALVPPRGLNLVRYHGVLAPGSVWRDRVVPGRAPQDSIRTSIPVPPLPDRPVHTGRRPPDRRYWIPWATLLGRVLGVDPLRCPACGSRMRILSYLWRPPAVQGILECLGLPSSRRPVATARIPHWDEAN